jgi:signal transduction histidine kinase
MSLVRQIFSGLRFRLLLLVVITCVPLIVLMLHTAGDERRRQVTSWQQRSEKLLALAEQEESVILGGTKQLLMAVAESSAVNSGNQRSCKKLLDELFASYPRYANLGVLSTNGELIASALPLRTPGRLTDHWFFRRTLETRAFSVGEFPSGSTNGRPALDFGYPVFDRNGDVQAVVFAALDLHWFDHFGSELPGQIPKAATWTEIERGGTILARYPGPEVWVGKRLPEQSLLEHVFERPGGIAEALDPDGVPSIYAFASMRSRLVPDGVVTILGIPKSVLFAQADRTLNRNLTWLGIAAAIAMALGWVGSNLLIIAPVKALVNASARLASGDLTVRTGLPHGNHELGQLTRAFDQMAEALEQRELERHRASQKLHVLSHRLVEVQETERRHIARELHDEIGQTLTTAEMNLQAALRAPNTPAIVRRLEDSIEAVERVLEQVHDLSLNLRPSMLDDLGLEPALRWYTQRQASLAGLKAEFRAEPLDGRLDPIIETECFRVAQEALTNVLRHAGARLVAVELRKTNGHLHLSVRDDGVGFDVTALRQEAVRGASLGLLSMEERTALAGGGIEYRSGNGKGTEVRAWFPLKWKVSSESPQLTVEQPKRLQA